MLLALRLETRYGGLRVGVARLDRALRRTM
jgi:hypothetical protein